MFVTVFIVLSLGGYSTCLGKGFDYEVCENWKRFGMSCYLPVNRLTTHSVADANCRQLHAFLAEIDTEMEQKFIFDQFMSKLEPKTGVWIGLINTSELGWTWNRGKVLAGYKGWGFDEPNNFMNKGETCAEMRYWDGKWNDIVCKSRIPYICEKEIKVRQTSTMATDVNKIDWSLNGQVIQTINVSGVLDCYGKCQAIPECLSFNYEYLTNNSLKTCELSKSTRGLVSKFYVKRKGFSYYD